MLYFCAFVSFFQCKRLQIILFLHVLFCFILGLTLLIFDKIRLRSTANCVIITSRFIFVISLSEMHYFTLTYKIIQLNLCNVKEIKISFVSLPAYKQSVDINLISWLNTGFSRLIAHGIKMTKYILHVHMLCMQLFLNPFYFIFIFFLPVVSGMMSSVLLFDKLTTAFSRKSSPLHLPLRTKKQAWAWQGCMFTPRTSAVNINT